MTQQQLVDQMALDLGVSIKNRRPYAREVFRYLDMDLLPRSGPDTLLGELYEWNSKLFRTRNKNIVAYLFQGAALDQMVKKLDTVPLNSALIPNFEFTKDHIIELGGSLPSVFNISFKGKLRNAKELNIVVSDVSMKRLTNYEEPGASIQNALSEYAQRNTRGYRRNIRKDFIAEALFYAASVEVTLDRSTDFDLDLSFDPGAKVEAKVESKSKKKYKLTYSGKGSPFAAKLRRGYDFFDRFN